jgi:dinuclear metal center YbgI/SA1388 family protein
MLILDLDKEAVRFAVENKIDLIITHHPFIFNSIKSVDYNTYDGQLIRDLIINNINVYSMHTSLDMAEYGVNCELACKLGLKSFDILHKINENDGSGYGGISNIEPINVIEYSNIVKTALNCNAIKLFCDDDKRMIKKVAFCGGSGSEFIVDAINNGVDLYITGDIKYHQAQDALKSNLCIIDAGHYNTEYHVLKKVQGVLKEKALKDVILIERNTVQEMII